MTNIIRSNNVSHTMKNDNIKGEWLLKALEIVERIAYTTADFIDDFCNSTKSDYRRLWNLHPERRITLAEKLREEIKESYVLEEKNKEQARTARRARNLLYKMQKDGLIRKSNENKWQITISGQRRKDKIKSSLLFQLPVKKYPKEPSSQLIIIGFDIPERERVKRDWLRTALFSLGFRRLQKSVFVGKTKVPEELIKDIRKLKFLDCLEIFAVSHGGTIKQISR